MTRRWFAVRERRHASLDLLPDSKSVGSRQGSAPTISLARHAHVAFRKQGERRIDFVAVKQRRRTFFAVSIAIRPPHDDVVERRDFAPPRPLPGRKNASGQPAVVRNRDCRPAFDNGGARPSVDPRLGIDAANRFDEVGESGHGEGGKGTGRTKQNKPSCPRDLIRLTP